MQRIFAIIPVLFSLCGIASADHVFINEFHYDNPGGDIGEFVEVGVRTPNGSGFSASDYVIEFYNGSNGQLYLTTGTLDTFSIINSFAVEGSTDIITLYSQEVSGIQNGAPDGLALVNISNSTVESFLSYEGFFTAVADGGGIAGLAGVTSTDIGVAEPGIGNTTSVGATGFGFGANQFGPTSFVLSEQSTPGQINVGQTFSTTTVVPEPSSLAVLMIGAVGVMAKRRRSQRKTC